VYMLDDILSARAHDAEPSQSPPVSHAKRIHRRRSGDSRRRQEGPIVPLIRSAIASGVISGRLERTLRHWAKLWGVPDLSDRITFHHNARLRTTIARWLIESSCLEVSTRFFELRCDHREILCHELAHAAASRIHGRGVRPHGREWRELMRKAGYEPRAHRASELKTHASPSDIPSRLIYEHRCAVCHAVRYGKKPVKSWRCVECVGAGLAGHLTIKVVPHGAGVR
jgi:predicted SprT family Zn-dependent metalloprotease